MGQFFAITGMAGVTQTAVKAALRKFASSMGGVLKPMNGDASVSDSLWMKQGKRNHVSILCPPCFSRCDEASVWLSRSLKAPAFAFHIHDSDLWMYILFANGKVVDRFNPIPDYWPVAVSAAERKRWSGNAAIVAKYWPGIEKSAIQKYLTTWDLENFSPGKAYDDDRFTFNDCWQMTDFMRQLGLACPVDEADNVDGNPYRFDVPE